MRRLLLLSPLGVLAGISLAVRVMSDQAETGQKTLASVSTAQRNHAPLRVQSPRDFDANRLSALKTLALLAATPVGSKTTPTASSASAPPPAKTSAPSPGTANLNGKAGSGQIASASRANAALVSASASMPRLASSKSGSHFVVEKAMPLRKPEAWTPPIVYGPPLPAERVVVQKQTHQLLRDKEAGRLTLTMDDRDGEQLRVLERDGIFCWPAPPAGVVVRSSRQRAVLDGTTDRIGLPASSQMQLASRGAQPELSGFGNPADDPDFDPCALPPSPLLLKMLTTLAGHSTSGRPLQLLSLLRPPYRTGSFVHVGAANPHSLGLAADIGAYGGHEIRQAQPEACVEATLALLRDLPPGRYRLGMPKAPEDWNMPSQLTALLNCSSEELASTTYANSPKTAALPQSAEAKTGTEASDLQPEQTELGGAISAWCGLYVSSAKPAWPFFPPPVTEVVSEGAAENVDEDAPAASSTSAKATGKSISNRRGNTSRTVVRFQNESYAPESALRDPRLRHALEAARKRGVDIVAMFPDGADHIHIDVRQNP